MELHIPTRETYTPQTNFCMKKMYLYVQNVLLYFHDLYFYLQYMLLHFHYMYLYFKCMYLYFQHIGAPPGWPTAQYGRAPCENKYINKCKNMYRKYKYM